MGHAKKVILVSESGDIQNRDQLLRELFDDRIELFCAVGKDAHDWEDAMSWIVTMAEVDEGIHHDMLRSMHVDESVDDAVEFAKQIEVPSKLDEIEIIRV
jgi:hypothetical protein